MEVKISIFLEPLVGRPTLYIFGDGYIALSLSEFARTLEFSVVVVDDREEFANQTRFPEAEVRLGNFVNLTRTLEFNEDDSIVIVTRGHEHDEEVLKECLSKAIQPRYIGMIGSKEKVAATFNHLKEQGIKEDLLRQVKAPTGLELGSEARRKSHSA